MNIFNLFKKKPEYKIFTHINGNGWHNAQFLTEAEENAWVEEFKVKDQIETKADREMVKRYNPVNSCESCIYCGSNNLKRELNRTVYHVEFLIVRCLGCGGLNGFECPLTISAENK